MGGDVNTGGQQLPPAWKEGSAKRALESGLVVLAADMYAELLRTPGFSDEQYLHYRLQLASSLIEQRRFSTARSVLNELPDGLYSSGYHLRRAIALYGSGRNVDSVALAEELTRIDPDELTSDDKPWFYLMRGLSAELGGRRSMWSRSFVRRETDRVSLPQGFLNALLYREKLRRAPADEALAAEIRRQLDNLDGPAAHAYAREYATVLYNLGRANRRLPFWA